MDQEEYSLNQMNNFFVLFSLFRWGWGVGASTDERIVYMLAKTFSIIVEKRWEAWPIISRPAILTGFARPLFSSSIRLFKNVLNGL